MSTLLDSLKGINGYPIPMHTLSSIAIRRNINLADTATEELMATKEVRLATADVMRWISFAPNVSQGGVSFDILYSDRERLRELANRIYGEYGDTECVAAESKTKYGYKGSRL